MTLHTTPHSDYILKLRNASRRTIDRTGVKAANLGELASVGFPVPEGFVLTTTAFERFLADNAFRVDRDPETVARGLLPADVAHALVTAATDLGDAPLAVRSSGVAEDLTGASFAGQYVTVLDVRDGGLEVQAGEDGAIGFIKRGDLGRDRDEQRTERYQVGQKFDALVTGFDRSKKPTFSVKALQIAEEKQAVAQYGSSDSGASLGDILGEALKAKNEG
jgi:small subunit ribosomal protein S1